MTKDSYYLDHKVGRKRRTRRKRGAVEEKEKKTSVRCVIKAAVCSFQTEWPSMEPEGTSCSSVVCSYSFPGNFKSEVVAGKGWNFNLWCLLTRGVSFCRCEQTEKPPWVRPFAGCWEGSRGGWAGLLGSRDKSLVGKTRQGSRK